MLATSTESPAAARADTPTPVVPPLLELELTGLCNLACAQCYASSGPHGSHGTMTVADWKGVIGQAAALGVRTVQFIGGEPGLFPGLPGLIRHALGAGARVHVFSNLVRVTPELWDAYMLAGTSIAFSWYSADPSEHARITGSRIAWKSTLENARKAVELGIPVRAAIIDLGQGQNTAAAEAEVRAAGVSRVTVRRVRQLGRAAGDGDGRDPAALCGRCGRHAAAVLPDGTLTPCVMGRWLDCGNVREAPLGELLVGEAWKQAVALVPPREDRECDPDNCDPKQDTDNCGPDDETVCK
jgi:MoaA/NifB/PqqE/SkfB family radical SAM enzyme